MMEARGLRSSRGTMRPCLGTFQAAVLRFLHDHVGAGLVGRVVQQTTDVVHEQRVQKIGDLFLVGKIQRTLERNPRGIGQWSCHF